MNPGGASSNLEFEILHKHASPVHLKYFLSHAVDVVHDYVRFELMLPFSCDKTIFFQGGSLVS